jgi:hypothetical protein
VVAAINHVTKGTYLEQILRYEETTHVDAVKPLVEQLVALRKRYEEALNYVNEVEKQTVGFKELHARRLVEVAGYLAITHILALQAEGHAVYATTAAIYGKLAAAKIEEAVTFVLNSTAEDVTLFKQIEEEPLN